MKIGELVTAQIQARCFWNTTGIRLAVGQRYLMTARGQDPMAIRAIAGTFACSKPGVDSPPKIGLCLPVRSIPIRQLRFTSVR